MYIVGQAPEPVALQAGHRLAHEALLALRATHDVDTIVLCNSKPADIAAARACATSSCVVSYNVVQKALGIILGMCVGIPPRFSTRLSLRAIKRVGELLAVRHYSLVWLEFSSTFWLLPRLVRSGRAEARVLSIHDVLSQVVERKSVLERTLFLGWTKRFESKMLRMATRIRVLSQKDADLAVRLCGATPPLEVVTPTLSPFIQTVRRSRRTIKPYTLLFWGAMNRTENHGAALRFVRKVLPDLLQAFPSAHLFVVGANPPPSLAQIAGDHVTVTGFVENPTPYFETASVGVAPLMSGAGIKLKTLEMLAAGLTVVSTPIGAEGIAPSPRLIVINFDSMAQAIIDLWKKVPTSSRIHGST